MLADKAVMSRYLLPGDQSCFCCGPAVSSGACSQEMLNQQLQGQDSTVLSSHSAEANQPFLGHTHNAPMKVVQLSNFLQEDSLCRQQRNQPGSLLDWNDFPGNGTCNAIHEFGMYQNQHSNSLFMPANCPAVSEDLRGQSSSCNFHILQNRELRGKMSGIIDNESKLLHSTPILGSDEYRSMPAGICDNSGVNPTNANPADHMDLDSALDELGILSTVASSRRQNLLETHEQASFNKGQQRLHSKSKSSPNLTALSHPNGYRIVQLNRNFVTNLSDALPLPAPASSGLFDQSALKFGFSQFECCNPNILEEASRRHRLSRKHKDRYLYRLSRCPYKIPNRFYNSLQESDFGPEYFNTSSSSFETAKLSSSTPSLEPDVGTLSNEQATCQQSSKSNTASPLKPSQDTRLTRSLSAEDLTSTCRSLQQELDEKCRGSSSTEQSLDVMTSQMTNLHMS